MRRRPHPDSIYALTFDCYGTLIDWRRGVERAVREIASLERCDIPTLVDARERMEREIQRGPYQRYDEVLASSLASAAQEQGAPLSADDARRFAASMSTWPPFEETSAAANRLATRFQLAILSNVETRVLEASVRLIDAPFEALITAEQLASYKPAGAHFEAAIEQLGLEPEQILHVAASLYHDVRPASERGFRVAWVNREGATPPADVAIDWTVPDLTTLAIELGC
jgi:2-haloacid dehalogenase